MIYKYFPKKPVGIIGNDQEQKYFTCNAFESAVIAKEYLAIPYEPLYRVKIIPNRSKDDIWEKFEGSNITNEKKRRTWAAFGLHGGAWEMITKQKFLEKSQKTKKTNCAGCWSIDKVLFTGGYIEEYSSFKKATEHDSMFNLLKRFLRFYKSRGDNGEFEGKEGFQWKVPDDFLGGIFYWRLNQFEYTVSVLIKANEEIYSGIKLWGVFWKDNGDKRTFYKPVEVVIPGFPLLNNQEIEVSNNSSDLEHFLNDRFDDVRETLVKKSIPIKLNKLTEYYDIILPLNKH
jgi:hypothetical protein